MITLGFALAFRLTYSNKNLLSSGKGPMLQKYSPPAEQHGVKIWHPQEL